MKKVVLNYLLITIIVLPVVFILCNIRSRSGKSLGKINITTKKSGKFNLFLYGSGNAAVDWGDGSNKVVQMLNEKHVLFEHIYQEELLHTISINGDNITGMLCNDIKDLDVSRCTELIWSVVVNLQA